MGSGRTGSLLASMLSDVGHSVVVIDWDRRAFARLATNYAGETVEGNGVDQQVLRQAGIEFADAFVAATSGDNRNIMASQVAKDVFRVPRVIARIKDPDRADIFGHDEIMIDCRTSQGTKALLDLVRQ